MLFAPPIKISGYAPETRTLREILPGGTKIDTAPLASGPSLKLV